MDPDADPAMLTSSSSDCRASPVAVAPRAISGEEADEFHLVTWPPGRKAKPGREEVEATLSLRALAAGSVAANVRHRGDRRSICDVVNLGSLGHVHLTTEMFDSGPKIRDFLQKFCTARA